MGCPIRGVILDPIVAMQMGIQGQVLTLLHDHFSWFHLIFFKLLTIMLLYAYRFLLRANDSSSHSRISVSFIGDQSM